ncbi:MAG: B12-binding domain-containing radical SAM protein, partial [Actinobacteria bacterium]|nr:B12-binding domain-containing radical SAM protein [Actinomycetota bacterium]
MIDIQLIKAPCLGTGMPEDKWYMPLNLIWIASYLEKHGYSVEILDGQHLGVEDIKNKITSKIIGISLDVLSVKSFNEIVNYARTEKGCTVVVGGQYATPLAQQILECNPSVDYVIRYDGEEAFLKLIRELETPHRRKLSNIPNLTWRDNESIRLNNIKDVNLWTLPLPKRDVGGLDIDQYIACYQRTKSRENLPFEYDRPTNAFSIKGCPRRIGEKGCSFCSRIDTHVRFKSPRQTFNEFRYLEEEFSVDYISDFSDNWVIPSWLKQLVSIYENAGGLRSKLRIYADPRDINEYTIGLLETLGVDTVLLGIESGDENVLRNNGKNMSINDTMRAVTLLGSRDMKVSDAYVLGLIGETKESVNKTVRLAKRIREACSTEISYWNILTPLPGSKAWKLLSDINGFSNTCLNSYKFNTVHLEKEFIRHFTKLGQGGYEFLMEVREQMLEEACIPS